MEPMPNEPGFRRVLIGTLYETIEGDLPVAQQVRTLDYLNRVSTRFLSLRSARSLTPGAAFPGERVSVSIATILWVKEVEPMRPSASSRVMLGLNRCGVRLCFPNCEVLGFLHAPPGGDPLARLNQEGGVFLALTSVSMTLTDSQSAADFLAVNSAHLYTAELIAEADSSPETAATFEAASS